jgi:hypothetical protein
MQLSERDLQIWLPRANQIKKGGTTLRVTASYLNPVRQIFSNIHYHYIFAFASSLSLAIPSSIALICNANTLL